VPRPVHDLIGSIPVNSISFTERQRKWKEELDQELERERGKQKFSLSMHYRRFPPTLIQKNYI
jgi:hypothetical protein